MYVNGIKLTPLVEYYVSDDRKRVYLEMQTIASDKIKVVLFGSAVCDTKAFEISKDMLNVFRYHRYSVGVVKLVKELKYYDAEIVVTDASVLATPIAAKNQPGIILINGERIEYLVKSGNTLSQLRRGSLGTPIADTHSINSEIADVSNNERLPYNESEMKESFIFDGSSHLIGPLTYTPVKSTRTNWVSGNIPEEYGPCDQVEVFFGGRRLRKNPVTVFNESLGATSPVADEILDAEFSVDGTANYIRLSDSVVGSVSVNSTIHIVVYRRVGKVWYEQTATTASNGITLLENNTAMAKFIAQKTTVIPG